MQKQLNLIEQLLSFLKKDEVHELKGIGLTLYRCDTPIERISYIQEPSICFILRGQKRVFWGQNQLQYGDGQYMCYSVDLPLVGQVLGASESYPYVGIQMKLNPTIILQLLIDLAQNNQNQDEQPSIAVGEIDEPMLDALIRLTHLACCPDDAAILAPLIQRELHYRLLKSPLGDMLRQMVALGGWAQRISQAITHLKQHFAEPLHIEKLAEQVNMSVPSFYKYFRQITAISPLQYQKSLRLTEARRLVKQNGLSLSEIAHQVGYESPSQFSREYGRYFGVSPSTEREQKDKSQ
ncbi:AraC family transcriptional regulator [Avibacterium sp. 20-126]|uniref:AraC family transcriptional regulator n=1 Tax=Avibacterium sp. 20-126 TaxID=2911524 RepID=UPI002188B0DC|nr:AraC family transcriptional regulator [Avibacterium sp. 20-126]